MTLCTLKKFVIYIIDKIKQFFVIDLSKYTIYIQSTNHCSNTRSICGAAFSERNVIIANRRHVRSCRSIRCNPIIDICIVEPAFDVYICCWVCKMNLLTVWSFFAKRWMSLVKAGLKSDILRYDIVKYTRTCAKLCPSCVKNATLTKVEEETDLEYHIIISVLIVQPFKARSRKTNLFQKW